MVKRIVGLYQARPPKLHGIMDIAVGVLAGIMWMNISPGMGRASLSQKTPAMLFGRAAMGWIIAFVVAVTMYGFIEEMLRRMGARRRKAMLAMLLLPVAVLAGGGWWVCEGLVGDSWLAWVAALCAWYVVFCGCNALVVWILGFGAGIENGMEDPAKDGLLLVVFLVGMGATWWVVRAVHVWWHDGEPWGRVVVTLAATAWVSVVGLACWGTSRAVEMIRRGRVGSTIASSNSSEAR